MPALRNATTGVLIIEQLLIARGFMQRAIGLLGRPALGREEGLWLKPCGSIHTIGMRFSIDLVFLNPEDCVVGIEPAIAPNRLMVRCPGAASVIEFASGSSHTEGIAIGDRLESTSLEGCSASKNKPAMAGRTRSPEAP